MRGAIEWPPTFLNGLSLLLGKPSRKSPRLKDRVKTERELILQETIRRVLDKFPFRNGYCLQVNEEDFKH